MEPGLASYTRKIVISPYVGGEGDYVISHIFKLAQIQVKIIQLYLALLFHWQSQGCEEDPPPLRPALTQNFGKTLYFGIFSVKKKQHPSLTTRQRGS